MRTLAGRTLLRAAFRQQSGARSLVSTTLPLLERKVIKVPTMGDSITEVSLCEDRSRPLLANEKRWSLKGIVEWKVCETSSLAPGLGSCAMPATYAQDTAVPSTTHIPHQRNFSHIYVQGTIVEWTAKVGQAVKADDVVALVETDKVTVEIKAEMDGVLTKQFGAV